MLGLFFPAPACFLLTIEDRLMMPLHSEDIDLDPPDNLVSTAVRNLALSALAVCAIAQLVIFLAS